MQSNAWLPKVQRANAGPVVANAGHGLHVPVPLKIESGNAQANGLANPFLRLIINSELAKSFDLAAAVALVLLGVDLIGFGSAGGEAVVASELAVHRSGAAIDTAVPVFHE